MSAADPKGITLEQAQADVDRLQLDQDQAWNTGRLSHAIELAVPLRVARARLLKVKELQC